MEEKERAESRFGCFNQLFIVTLALIFCATLIALPFSNTAALRIYLFGCVISALVSIFEVRNRRIMYQMQGAAATESLTWSRSQGGLLGKLVRAMSAVLLVLLWPSRVTIVIVHAAYALKRVNNTTFITHFALLIPKFLLHIPDLLVLSWMTYRGIHANGYTVESIIFVAITTLCAALYMLLVGAASFRAYVSHNLIHPAVNAVLIAIQLGLTILFVVANLLPLARPGAHGLSAAVVQLFNLSELAKNLKQTALALFAGAPAPGENLAYGVLVLVIIAGFYATVIKAILTGVVFGRSEAGRLAAGAYFRTRGDFRKASNLIKGVDNKSPAKHSLLLQVQLARGEAEGSFATASRLLRLVNAEDSPENQSALIAASLGFALAGMETADSRKGFALGLIAALRARKVHDLFAIWVLRDLYVAKALSDEDIEDIKAELLAAQPDHFLWDHLELVTVPQKANELTFALLASAAAAAARHADFFSRAALFWPIFVAWSSASQVEISPEAPEAAAAQRALAEVPAALKTTLDEALARRYDRKFWEALFLVNFIGTPVSVLAAMDTDGRFVSEEHLAAVDEWMARASPMKGLRAWRRSI